MKLNPTHIILAFFFLLSLTATQCKKDPPPGLPPETQIGANTFGCYVNDELHLPVKKRPLSFGEDPGLIAGYNQETNQFGIQSYAKDIISFIVDYPQENEYSYFSFLMLENPVWHVCFNSDNLCDYSNNSGRVFFTRFDTINNIASGRFDVKFVNDCLYFIRR